MLTTLQEFGKTITSEMYINGIFLDFKISKEAKREIVISHSEINDLFLHRSIMDGRIRRAYILIKDLDFRLFFKYDNEPLEKPVKYVYHDLIRNKKESSFGIDRDQHETSIQFILKSEDFSKSKKAVFSSFMLFYYFDSIMTFYIKYTKTYREGMPILRENRLEYHLLNMFIFKYCKLIYVCLNSGIKESGEFDTTYS